MHADILLYCHRCDVCNGVSPCQPVHDEGMVEFQNVMNSIRLDHASMLSSVSVGECNIPFVSNVCYKGNDDISDAEGDNIEMSADLFNPTFHVGLKKSGTCVESDGTLDRSVRHLHSTTTTCDHVLMSSKNFDLVCSFGLVPSCLFAFSNFSPVFLTFLSFLAIIRS